MELPAAIWEIATVLSVKNVISHINTSIGVSPCLPLPSECLAVVLNRSGNIPSPRPASLTSTSRHQARNARGNWLGPRPRPAFHQQPHSSAQDVYQRGSLPSQGRHQTSAINNSQAWPRPLFTSCHIVDPRLTVQHLWRGRKVRWHPGMRPIWARHGHDQAEPSTI